MSPFESIIPISARYSMPQVFMADITSPNLMPNGDSEYFTHNHFIVLQFFELS